MRIIHLLASNQYSGAENVCMNLIRILSEDPSNDVYYCSTDGPIKDILNKKHINYIPLKKFTLANVRKIIKELNPDVIHAHDIRASVYAAMGCQGKPVISHVHGKFYDMSVVSPKSLLYKIFSKRFKYVFYVSKSILDEFKYKEILLKKGVFLPNRLNPSEVQERASKANVEKKYDVIYLGRLVEVKNPMRFLTLVKRMKEVYPEIKCCMIGAGSEMEHCQKFIQEEDLPVDLLGFQAEPLGYLANSKVLMMTSVAEGLPMVALEAMALGKPIVTTPVDGLKEVIKNGVNGYISSDDEELITVCLHLLQNADAYEKISQNIKNGDINGFSYEQYKQTVLDVYSQFKNKL